MTQWTESELAEVERLCQTLPLNEAWSIVANDKIAGLQARIAMTPTQEQIEAAAKVIATRWQSSPSEDQLVKDTAKAALTAAAGVGRDGGRKLPIDRDELGRMVREAWVRWALTQPNPKPSWLTPYNELSEPDKEADRQIGEAICRWTLIYDAAAGVGSYNHGYADGVKDGVAAAGVGETLEEWDANDPYLIVTREAERERCAQVADQFDGYDWDNVAPLLAERIRALKDKP